MKRITNRILCEEVRGQACGEVVVRGQFSQWEIKARCENDYAVKFGGVWEVHLGKPEQFQEAPGCTMYEVTAKRVLKANTAPPPPSHEPAKDGPENDLALSAMGVANAAIMASHAALDGHLEDIQTYLKIIERNVEIFRTRMPGWKPDLKIGCEIDPKIDESYKKAKEIEVSLAALNEQIAKKNAAATPPAIDTHNPPIPAKIPGNMASQWMREPSTPEATPPADTRSLGHVLFDAYCEIIEENTSNINWTDLYDSTRDKWEDASAVLISVHEARKAVNP